MVVVILPVAEREQRLRLTESVPRLLAQREGLAENLFGAAFLIPQNDVGRPKPVQAVNFGLKGGHPFEQG